MNYKRLTLPAILAATLAADISQADDRATAQQLFQQGKTLLAQGKTAEACSKFEGAAELSPTAGVRLNLAECWDRLGRTASAWSKYDEALSIAERSGDSEAAGVARKGRADLEPKLSYLTVVVTGDATVPGMELFRDGQKLPQAAWNTAVPVDPGEHEVSARAPGRKPWTLKRAVSGPGIRVEIAIPALAEEPKPQSEVASTAPKPVEPTKAAAHPEPPAAAPDTDSSSRDSGGSLRTMAYVAGGLGLVGIGVGSYFGLKAKAGKSDYEEHLAPDGECADARCETLSKDAHSAGNASTVSFIAGGALLATGVVLWSIAPSGASPKKAGLSPVLGTQMAGLEMKGSW